MKSHSLEVRALLVRGQVLLEVLGHGECLDLLGSEDGSHGGVGGEPLLVLGVLEVLLLEIGPKPLDHLFKSFHDKFYENWVLCT